MIKFIIGGLFIAIFAMSYAQASSDGKLKLVGYVTGFDQSSLTIESGNQRFQIPRTMYPVPAKSGEMISVAMTQEEFSSLKRIAPTAKH